MTTSVGRKFESSDPEVKAFVECVSATERETWLSYLVLLGLNAHLSRYVTSSPFVRGTHLDTRMVQLIKSFSPDLSTIEIISFRAAVQRFVREEKIIGSEFDYREP